jgi:hypothetical protein
MSRCIVALALLIGFSACTTQRSAKPAAGSVQHGDFVVEPLLPSAACASAGLARPSQKAQRIFYKDRLVTSVALMPVFSPRNPGRMLYTAACSKDGTESGTFYFGGSLSAPVRVNPLGMYEPPKDFDLYWSPDDKFVVVRSTEGHLTLANLQTGTSSKDLEELFESKEADSSGVYFLGWSPDGKGMAIMVTARYTRDDRSEFSDYDLESVDPATLKAGYIATIRRDGWSGENWYGGKSIWVEKDGSYELEPGPDLKNDSALIRKRR